MKIKCLITILMAIVLIQVVGAGMCEDKLTPGQSCTLITPTLNCNTSYTIYNETLYITTGNMTLLNDSIYYINFSQGTGDYVIQLCDNSTREIYVEGEDEMAGLAIVVFILAIVGAMFVVPFKVEFHNHEILNELLKRICWLVGLFLLALGSVMVITIADNAGIPLFDELFRFTWLIMWSCYLFMVWIVISFFFKVLKLWSDKKNFDRTGGIIPT